VSCIKHGDTLRVSDSDSTLDSHVWFVVSDPAKNKEKVLLLNLTSYGDGRGKDPTCILESSDHSCIKWKSCIEYGRPKKPTADELHRLYKTGGIKKLDPMSAALLKKILAGCAHPSSDLAIGFRRLLADQGLIQL
jgi:hypothetical protein